ncbi:MAG: AAA family ATPase [Eubacteriales bacterium]
MDTLQLQNLKCFKDSGEIPIKPITVLVGKNSSGKSTFLRTFPLFRQSIESRTRGPILWYGQYVDFGSYNDAVRRDSSDPNKRISFTYTTTIIKDQQRFNRFLFYSNRVFHFRIKDNETHYKVRFTIGLESKQKISYFPEISLVFDWGCFCIRINEKSEVNSLSINNKEYIDLFKNQIKIFESDSFFPTNFVTKSDKNKQEVNTFFKVHFEKPLYAMLKSLNHKSTTDEKLSKILQRQTITDRESFLSDLKMYSKYLDLKVWGRNISKWTVENQTFQKFYDYYLLCFIPDLLEMVDYEFCHTMENVHYIAPVRASAERYYRIQDLSVDDVDFQGKNLPMFIQALGNTVKKQFQDWVEKNFNFIPDVETEKGHLSLLIRTPEGFAFNIADKGFGYSQILPIITQLWSIVHSEVRKNLTRGGVSYRKKDRRLEKFLVIEQPELHLHPAFQSCLVQSIALVVDEAKRKGIILKIILETHSETIINSIGHLIADRKLCNEDVGVVIFGQESNEHRVTLGNYDKDGFLSNWPIGFFSPIQ